MLNRSIHKKEFRLRILLTNKCNENCHNCLNDFQAKGTDFIDPKLVYRALTDYFVFSYLYDFKPIVSFSGGEPGLHPKFPEIMHFAQKLPIKIQLNTNGLVDKRAWVNYKVDIRYHVGENLQSTKHSTGTAVLVITDAMSLENIIGYLKPFYLAGMKIKTFVDFFGSVELKNEYPILLKKLNKCFPTIGRFTGIQENRGPGCDNCTKECITLKALWVYPNGKCSPCPQKSGKKYSRKQLLNAYNFHKVEVYK